MARGGTLRAMDIRRLRVGEWIVGAAGVALFVSLFLDWYSVKGAKSGLAAWDAFDVTDVMLCVVALSAIALAAVTLLQQTPAIPVAMASIITLLAVVGLGLVVYRAIDAPADHLSTSTGLWVALVSSAAILAGSVLAIRNERPGAPAPAVEAEELPAPGS
jgi:hypothetical protein